MFEYDIFLEKFDKINMCSKVSEFSLCYKLEVN